MRGCLLQASLFQFQTGPLQLVGYQFFIGQDRLVLGCKHFVGEVVEGVVSFGNTFLGTENQANWRIFASLHPMFPCIVQIQVHLTCICVIELSGL